MKIKITNAWDRLRRVRFQQQSIPWVLLGLTILVFGPLIPKLGFYWDDWAKILVSQRFGLAGYWSYYAGDRPLSAWTHILLTPLLGTAPLGWHIFTLVMRWLSAWGLYKLLSALWPAHRLQSFAAACIFLVYPVFTMQAIAVTFHQQWLQYALVMFSLLWMIHSIRRPDRYAWLTAASLTAALVQLSVTEYFIGLELLRPLIVWFLFSEERPLAARIRGALRAWFPYLLLLTGYVLYRLFFINLPGNDPYQAQTLFGLFTNPGSTLLWLLKTVFIDLQYTLISVWTHVLSIGVTPITTPFAWFSLVAGLGMAAALAVYFIQLNLPASEQGKTGRNFAFQLMALGVLGVLCGPISAWATGRQIVSDFHSNRYALPAMLGASLLVVALFEIAQPRRLPGIMIFCALFGLLVGYHLRVENDYRWVWQKQLDTFWQLYWRAPVLQPGTALLFQDEPIENQGLFSTSSALNLMYPPATRDGFLPYWVYTVYPRYAQEIPDPEHISYSSQFRTLRFKATGQHIVMAHKDPSTGNCLWILNELDRDNPYLKESTRLMVSLSNLNRVLPASTAVDQPPVQWFGREPAHDWCYLFETADLAVQQRDWRAAVGLYDQAVAQGFTLDDSAANSPREWMPFIETFGHTQRWDDAVQLTVKSLQQDQRYSDMLCGLWTRILAATEASPERSVAQKLVRELKICGPSGLNP